MNRLLTICAVTVFVLVMGSPLVCDFAKAADDGCATIQGGTIVDPEGNPITLGSDQWGYNYAARIFSGLYLNYSRPEPPWTKETLEAANESTTSLTMKWNDAWLSTQDCDGDGLLDQHYGYSSFRGSGAWVTNLQTGSYEVEVDGKIKEAHWTYFAKIVAAPSDAYTATNGDGVPMYYGADDVEIGPVIWTEFAIVLEVFNDPFDGVHGRQYLSPTSPGLGYYHPETPVADFFAVPRTGWDIYYTTEFVSLSAGQITSYLWDFGDGQTSSDMVASHKYASPGAYTVSLTVTGPSGSNTMTKENYITVNDFDDYPYDDYILTEPNENQWWAALDAIEAAGGGRILFDFNDQTIYVSDERNFYGSNCIVDGQDKNVKFYYSGPDDCSQTEGQDALIRFHGDDNIFRNLDYDRFPEGVHMRGGNRNLIENVTVDIICEDATTWNGGGNYCLDCVIRDCTFGPSSDKTMMINSWSDTKAKCVITGCYSYNGNQPIRSSSGGLLTVRNCEFEGSRNNGPRFGGNVNSLVIFENNHSHETKSGLRLSSRANIIVRNNIMENCRDWGIRTQSTKDILARIENNTFSNNGGNKDTEGGVYLDDDDVQLDLGGGWLDVHRGGLTSGPGTVVTPSQGGNTLTGNTDYDLINNSGRTVKAERNFWDHSTIADVLLYDITGNASADVDPLGTP